jgi:ribosome biogenesis GTPase
MEGVVVKIYGRYYTVKADGREVNTVLRGRLKQNPDLQGFSSPVAVGDRVVISLNREDESGAIDEILPRKNYLARKDRIQGKEDLLAANLDMVMPVQSFRKPRLNHRFVDRIMARALCSGIPVALCVNKEDLARQGEREKIEMYYRRAGCELVMVSAHEEKGMEELLSIVRGKRVLMAGASGVGKTTLLNRLFPGTDHSTSHISEKTGKGRHTTTNAVLIRHPDNTEIIDTPGMREFGVSNIEPHLLERCFPDFDGLRENCRFSPCTHDHEPGCAVIEARDRGDLNPERHRSYLNILHSLQDEQSRMY